MENIIVLIIQIIIWIFIIATLGKIFAKAREPSWLVLIPIFNIYILLKIADKSGWWLLLLLVPLFNFIVIIIMSVGLAANFGKGIGFAIGLILLPFIFYPILAFGSAKYQA